ncbi:MAG: cytochrome c biogenesis protein CcdA [Candidatus Limnocylindrales bacterium]
MLVLVPIAFIAGVLSILAPCTLPVVPLVLGLGAGGGRRRPLGIVVGLGVSFVAVTILLASVLAALGLSTVGLRLVAVVALGTVGLSLAWPRFARGLEAALTPLVRPGMWIATGRTEVLGSAPRDSDEMERAGGFTSGLAIGAAIGLVWAPCVGPIMAGMIAIAATRGPSLEALAVAAAYVGGAAIPLLAVARWGRRIANGRRWLASGDGLRRACGVLTVVAALLIATGLDARVQAAVTAALPEGWSAALYSIEKQPAVQQEVQTLSDRPNATAAPPDVVLGDYGPAPEVAGITAWLNSEPLTLSGLRGRVVLVHFWTFGCINCRNVQPYVKAWYDRFAGDGFEVIGVHTPELSFEKDLANVRQAVIDQGVKFPVAFDPDFRTWNAYANGYWPASYYVDRSGRIRYVHIGEGGYSEQEEVIRMLLAEPAAAAAGSSSAAR